MSSNDIRSRMSASISRTVDSLRSTFNEQHIGTLHAITDMVVETIRNGNTVLLCGNGGSAADCQHVAAEFVGRFMKERASYPAIALTTDTSILTAIGNDYGYDQVFSRQVEGLGREGDLLIGISTSGNSPNVVRAVDAAKKKGIRTVGFTGKGGGKLGHVVDCVFAVDSSYTPHIQAAHIIALHTLCETAEELLCV